MADRTYPLNREKLREEYEEVILKMALAKYMERKSYEAKERLKEQPEPPCRIDFAKVVDREQPKEKHRKTMGRVLHIAGKVVTKAAVVFLVLALSFTTAFAASPEIRKAVFKLVSTQYDRYTEIHVSEEEKPAYVRPNSYEGPLYDLSFIPEGYDFFSYNEDRLKKDMIFINDDSRIVFKQVTPNAKHSGHIDTENADDVRTIMIGDCEALFCLKQGFTTIAWQDEGTFLELSSNSCDPQVLMSVANGIKKVKK